MVLFDISSEGSCERVTRVSRHAPMWNITVLFYIWADRFIISFLSKSSQVLCSGGGRVTPSARA